MSATTKLRRCGMCGYDLHGLEQRGTCPECGSTFGPEGLLKPWPSAGRICLQLGWPLLGVLLGITLTSVGAQGSGVGVLTGIVVLWIMLVAIPVNSYFRVRGMLKGSLPEHVRTRGPVAILRGIGTTLCLVLFLVFFGVPVTIIGVCLSQV